MCRAIYFNPEFNRFARAQEEVQETSTEEQAPDGYWGEWSRNGPTTGYDYLTMAGVALYYERSHDPTALEALRRSTDFHKFFTWPDGTPVETSNDRNRYWGVSP